MHCVLCLKPPKKSIAIFGKHGVRLGVKNIIEKHFWLQLNKKDDSSFNMICSLCWKSLQSFHKFYVKVEEAHGLLAKINYDDPIGTSLNDIKLELNDDSKIELQLNLNETPQISPESEEQINQMEFPIDTFAHDDSDSEIPLSTLTQQLLTDNNKEFVEKIPKSEDITIENVEITEIPTKEEKFHIQEGKWLAKCFGEETTTKSIPNDELDKFIKLNTQLTCEICQVPMNDFTALQIHFKDTHSNIKTFVTCCVKKFELRSRLVDHILLHKFPNYFTCVVCSKVLSCRLNLKKHMDIHEDKKVFQCDKCDKSFNRKEVFNRHVLDIHTLDRKFKCEECDKLFASKCSLNTHIYGVHRGRYKKICEQCGKVSCDQETFLRHQMKHSNQPLHYFQCPQCTVKLSTKHGLRHHIRYQHSQDTREHVCNVCGTITTTEAALKRHVTYMHKYKRDFKCTMCDKAFKRALTLKEHMTTHTGEVLYTCPHCPKTFNSNANMHSHRKKMHRKEWEENRRHPHLGTSANAAANRQAMANQNASEDNNTQ